MLDFNSTASALLDPHASAASVAATLGQLGEWANGSFKVAPPPSENIQVRIAAPQGDGRKAVPTYVQIELLGGYAGKLKDLFPACEHWQSLPSKPHLPGYNYSCRLPGSTKALEVDVVCRLSAELDKPSYVVRSVLFQRNNWQ